MKTGDEVTHEEYGKGIIREITQNGILIDFVNEDWIDAFDEFGSDQVSINDCLFNPNNLEIIEKVLK